jgi:hypothetical protein
MITVDAEILSNNLNVEVELTSNILDVEVEFPAISIGGGVADVVNSDLSYSDTVNAGDTLILPDEELKVFVNGILNQATIYIPLSNQTINIQ